MFIEVLYFEMSLFFKSKKTKQETSNLIATYKNKAKIQKYLD